MLTGDKVKKIVTAVNKKGDLLDIIADLKKSGRLTYLEKLLFESPMTLKTAKLIDVEIKKVAKEKNLAHISAATVVLGIDLSVYYKIMRIIKRDTEIF